jgi:(1->4)-alpha-D-glucan 1-alpha-D-glucosylmutase
VSAVRATYRLQFRNGFDFAAASGIAGYLARLGVSHAYASPVFTAETGSSHGYDITDFNEIDPVLGGREGLEAFADELKRHGLGLILDFVPNHMAASFENGWWREALRTGPDGPHGNTFDIDWSRGDGRVLLPFLGDGLEATMQRGELRLEHGEDGFALVYFDRRLPVNAAGCTCLPDGDPRQVAAAVSADPAALGQVVDLQFYRPVFWRRGPRRINYRRFFEIDELVALRMDRAAVFDAVHALLLELIRAGTVQGVRLDHIDGLADPAAYLHRLRNAIDRVAGGVDVPVWVEKILAHDERLDPSWPVSGTTGYEFAALATRLQIDAAGLETITRAYEEYVGEHATFAEVAASARREILMESFPAQLADLSRIASTLLRPDVSLEALERVLREILVCVPVYRTYLGGTAPGAGRERFATACATARETLDAVDHEVLDALASPAGHPQRGSFFTRLEQLSTALAAKAVEDTALYRYVPLTALNEVGSDPSAASLDAAGFHDANRTRLRDWPATLLATASHDTKRGEDVRARLAVLSEAPGLLFEAAARCRGASHRAGIHPKDAWLAIQTAIAMLPPGPDPGDRRTLGARLQDYLVKAAREARERSSWTDPDEAYEAALCGFAAALVEPGSTCFDAVADVADRIAAAGAVNGLTQLLFKLAAPGIPDIYQGSEFWDLSLVDPDNRRAVDFAARRTSLERHAATPIRDLVHLWRDGTVKQAVMARVLALRASEPNVFATGEYLPLRTLGPLADRVVAFARADAGKAVVVAGLLRSFGLLGEATIAVDPVRLRGTELEFDKTLATRTWEDCLSGRTVAGAATVACETLFDPLPFCLLMARSATL